MMREAELVVRFAAGEPGSVAEVYRTYGRLVYTVTYRVLGDASLAEDASRRTFVKAWRLAASFDPGRTLGSWLASIAGRTAIDMHHRRSEHRQHGNLDAAATTQPEPVRETHTAEQIYNVGLVRRAIDALPDQDRELIRLQHHRQLTPTEIAARLGIPLGSLKSRSYRAHRRFAGLLGQLRAADRPSR